jgi:hypothetical protein
VSGPLFGFSDTRQLVINTGTTVLTFLMVFIIQNTIDRDSAAMRLTSCCERRQRLETRSSGPEGSVRTRSSSSTPRHHLLDAWNLTRIPTVV